jgi:hypothetical protein
MGIVMDIEDFLKNNKKRKISLQRNLSYYINVKISYCRQFPTKG